MDPLPDYVPPYETPHSNPELARRYALDRVSPKPHAFLNTQYANEPLQRRRQGEQAVLLHPKDGAARHIESGNYVRVFNDHGSFEVHAEPSEDSIMPGIVMASAGYWPSLSRSGTSVHSTGPGKHCTLGQDGAFSDNLVDVGRV